MLSRVSSSRGFFNEQMPSMPQTQTHNDSPRMGQQVSKNMFAMHLRALRGDCRMHVYTEARIQRKKQRIIDHRYSQKDNSGNALTVSGKPATIRKNGVKVFNWSVEL